MSDGNILTQTTEVANWLILLAANLGLVAFVAVLWLWLAKHDLSIALQVMITKYQAARKEYENYLSYGEGGAGWEASQVLGKLYVAEQRIEELEAQLKEDSTRSRKIYKGAYHG